MLIGLFVVSYPGGENFCFYRCSTLLEHSDSKATEQAYEGALSGGHILICLQANGENTYVPTGSVVKLANGQRRLRLCVVA